MKTIYRDYYNVKYFKEKLGIFFYSDSINLDNIRVSDLFYIAYSEIYPDNEIPDNKTISKILKINNTTRIEIIYNSINHCYKAIFKIN